MDKYVPHTITESSISLFLDKPYVIPNSHPNFEKIKEALRCKEWSSLPDLVDIPQAIRRFGKGQVEVFDGIVQYQGRPIHNVLTSRILRMMGEGFDVDPMVAFLDNLMQNPSRTAIEELYLFLERGNLPLTEDGHFLAYKIVRSDYSSYHPNPDGSLLYNRPGEVVEMPRNEVDDNRDRTCSYGLHFCSKEYLPHYGGSDGKVVVLKINPRDVVSIPSDYNNTKGRACRYEVVGELDKEFTHESLQESVVETVTTKTFVVTIAAFRHGSGYTAQAEIDIDATCEESARDLFDIDDYDIENDIEWFDPEDGSVVPADCIDESTIRIRTISEK